MFVRRCPIVVGVLAASTLLASCAVGPDFNHPHAPDVDRYTREPLAARTTSTDVAKGHAQHFVEGRDIPGEWWRLFQSPGLNSLIRKSLDANPNVQAALAALQAAREMARAQRGKFFPLVQANFNPTRQQVPLGLSSPLSTGDSLFNLFTAQVLVSYTFDVWGLNRRTVESLDAQADFQRFQVEAAYLTLTSNVVVAAIQEASLRAQIDATNQLIAISVKIRDTLRNQLNAGYVNRSDLAAQEAALAQTRSTLPPLRKQLAQQRDLLAALAGRFPSQEPSETFKLAALRLPVDLPVSLPSLLVQQRPDVRAAEEQLHSASALVGVATANMLPNLTINANGGYSAVELAGLASPVNQFWLLAGNATQTVFDGFTLLHQKRAAEAAYDQAAAQYRGTVIGAFQNVADTLRALQNDADALSAARDFERAAKVSLVLAQQQVLTVSNAPILLLLNAQQTYQQAVIAVVQAQANRLSDTAALYQALGGGWWNREELPTEKTRDIATVQLGPYPESKSEVP
jgi:NodT family efflux transporter outer membrane factor (OMF) lipoprotein